MNINGTPEDETDDMAIRCYTMMKNMYQKDYSEILKLFFGIHVSQIVNPKSKKVLSNSPEPFFVVELPIPSGKKNPTLYDCFSHYSHPERLEGDNAWYNEKTKNKEDVDKQMVFWSLPNIMVIALKRFTNMNRKINLLVDVPHDNLDLSPYVKGYNKETINTNCLELPIILEMQWEAIISLILKEQVENGMNLMIQLLGQLRKMMLFPKRDMFFSIEKKNNTIY